MGKAAYIFIFLFSVLLFRPQEKVNAFQLETQLETEKSDTSRIKLHQALALEYFKSDKIKCIFHFNKAKELASKKGNEKFLANLLFSYGKLNAEDGMNIEAERLYLEALFILQSLKEPKLSGKICISLGTLYYSQGNYLKANNLYHEAGNFGLKCKDSLITGNYLTGIGLVNFQQYNLSVALDNYLKALKIFEKIKDKPGMKRAYNNIGNLYSRVQNYPLAVTYFEKALALEKELKDDKEMIITLGNIGGLFQKTQNNEKAKAYFAKAYEMGKDFPDPVIRSKSLMNYASVFMSDSNFTEALKYLDKALEINLSAQDSSQLTENYILLCLAHSNLKHNREAIEFGEKALKCTKGSQDLAMLENLYVNLHVSYSNLGQWQKAYLFQTMANKLNDSIASEKILGQIQNLNVKYESEKKEIQIQELHERDKLREVELKANKAQNTYLIFGSVLLSGLLLLAFVSYRQKNKLNKVLEESNKVITENNIEITEKNFTIETKNKEIIDSIVYAKRIQDAMLKEVEHVSLHLPEHFVLFSPKDIVSGDFYWSHEREGYWYLAAVDCTGHGVPGGFLTMLGTSFLNEIISTKSLLSPAEVMNELRAKMIKELGSSETKEGMDMSLTKLNLETFELEWAGANVPFWFIESGLRQVQSDKMELKEIKANFQPIGIYDNPLPFTNHTKQLKKGDCYYLFSDGFADQFGGKEDDRKKGGKKIKNKKFQELILKNANLPMADQKNFLLQYLKNWRGDLPQNDDVLVMGVRL